jgi:hypothetical protein
VADEKFFFISSGAEGMKQPQLITATKNEILC